MVKVSIILENGFEEIEAVTLIDVLRRAEIEVIITGASKLEVIGAHNIEVKADELLKEVDLEQIEMLIFPGGMPGTLRLKENSLVLEKTRKFHDSGKTVAAICAAPLVLESVGILNCSYTCYPGLENEINCGEHVKNQNVVVDQNIMTSKGPGTAMEFALEIVRKLKGEKSYSELKESLLF